MKFILPLMFTTIFLLTGCTTKQKSDPINLASIKYYYKGHLAERKIAYDFFWEEDGKYMPWIKLEHVGVGFFDLNDDGEQEMFAYVNNPDMCPNVGCPHAAFKKINGKYSAIAFGDLSNRSGSLKRQDTYIINSKHNGYYDITFGDLNKVSKALVWKWDGEKYD